MLTQNYCIQSNPTLYQTMLYFYGSEEICPSSFLCSFLCYSQSPLSSPQNSANPQS